ncbi:MAG: AAA family ATPase [Clostridia bacterium]|nr:AAA family ATPase [Clostridia bacterium]
MIIEKIEIGSFGKLNKVELNLSRGVNIIRGGNESGKSTICNFIVFMFYGLPSKLEEKMKYISWDTSCARGAITILNDDGVRYRIERESICQSTGDGKVTFRERHCVYEVNTNTIVAKDIQPGDFLFGVPEIIFADTVYIRQINGTKIGDKNLSEAAENILFSGSEGLNTKKAIKKLDEARVYLYHKNRKGGRIFDLSTERDDLQNRLEQSLQSSNEIINLECSERLLIDAKAKSETRAESLKEELDTYEAYTVKKAYDSYKHELQNKKQVEDDIEIMTQSKDFGGCAVYTDEYISNLEKMSLEYDNKLNAQVAAKERLDKANKRIEDMHEKIKIFEEFGDRHGKRDSLIALAADLHDKIKTFGAIKKASLFGAAFFFIAVIALITVDIFVSSNLKPFVISVGVLLGICLVAFVALTIILTNPKKDLKKICKTFGCKTYSEFDELVKAATNDKAIMEFITEERDNAKKGLDNACDNFNSYNNEILTEIKSANIELKSTTPLTIKHAIEICKAKRNEMNALKNKIVECNAKIFEIQKTFNSYTEEYITSAYTASYDTEKMEAYDFHSKRRDYEFLTNSIKMQTEKLHDVQKNLAALRATVVNPTDIADKKNEIQGEINNLTDKFEAYQLACESMITASGKLREGLAPKIAQNASVIMNKLSAGKYSSLGVNSDFEMTFKDQAISHSVDYLSAGTTDIAYISLRIALIDVLYRKSIPPFIFDESFMRMDNERMTNSLKLLCDFGETGTQSLLFTCHGREEKLMRTIGEYTYYNI